MLNMIVHGEPTDKPGLVIVHGLFGSARNWGVIARRLSDERQVVTVDQRNHGDSPWFDSHRYPDMAADLAGLLRGLGGRFDVLGHSMGGKASMVLALQQPELVHRLIVADVAPVPYRHTQIQYVDAMQSVDLSRVSTRADAAEQLAARVDDPQLVPFFLQSLDLRARRWRLNLDVLRQDMAHILSFPDLPGSFDKPTLFLLGRDSRYVLPEHRPVIRRLFPQARFVKLNDAGHWLHADQPRAFETTLRKWLNAA